MRHHRLAGGGRRRQIPLPQRVLERIGQMSRGVGELCQGCGVGGPRIPMQAQTAIQIDLDDDLRGRVMSLWVMVGIGATATGAVVLGFLIDHFGFELALGSVGGLGVAVLGVFVARIWHAAA